MIKTMKNYFFIYLLFVSVLYAENKKFTILNLNSGSSISSNAYNLNKGLHYGLSPIKDKIVLYSEYLDVKTFDKNEYFKLLNKFYGKKYKNISFDLILINNKIAFDFVNMYHDTLFQDTQIFLGNVKNSLLVKSQKNYIYINSKKSINKFILYFQEKHKNIKKIYILSDEKNKQNLKELKNDIKENKYNYEFFFLSLENNYDEIKNLEKKSLILFNTKNEKKYLKKYLFEEQLLYSLSFNKKLEKDILGALFYNYELLGRTYSLLIRSALKGNYLEKRTLSYDLRSFVFNETKLASLKILKNTFPKNSILEHKIKDKIDLDNRYPFSFILLIFLFISLSILFLIFITKFKNIRKSNENISSLNYKMEQNEEKIISLTDNLPGLVYRVRNAQFNSFEYLSKAAFELTGYTKEQLINKQIIFYDLMLEEDKKMHQEKIKHALKSFTNYHIQYEILTQNNVKKTLYEIGRGIYDSSKDLIALEGYISDVSELTQAQNKIIKMNVDLEHTVFERTVEIEESNKELQRVINDLKNTHTHLLQSEKMASLGSLVAGVSHEINTPVGLSLLGMTHFMDITKNINKLYNEKKLEENDFEEYLKTSSELATSINFSLLKAVELIKSFKQIAVDQSSDLVRTFNIYNYIEEILLSIENKTKKMNHSIFIMCDENLIIKSFPGVISQILTNLVMNSITHAFEHIEEGSIVIKVEVSAKRLFITFSDNGAGIKKEDINKIFDPFFTTKRDEGGSGLGLNIVYNLVTSKLKGKVECNSLLNIGTEFKITFMLE